MCLISYFYSTPQSFIYAKTYDNYWQDDVRGTGIDSSGNIYITGKSAYTTGGQGSSGHFILCKFNPEGNLIWKDTLNAVVKSESDMQGNTFVVTNDNISKFDSSGVFVWQQIVPNKIFKEVHIHPEGGVIVSGWTYIGNNAVSAVYRLSQNGNILWSRVGDFAAGGTTPNGICCDRNGNTFVVGSKIASTGMVGAMYKIDNSGNLSFSLTVPYEPERIIISKDSAIYVTGESSTSAFVKKFEFSGNSVWTHTLNASIADIKIDKQGQIIVAGTFYQNVQSDNISLTAAAYEMYIFKIDTLGNTFWGAATSGPAYVNGSSNGVVRPTKIIVDGNNDIIVSGIITGQHSFDQITINSANLYSDIFLAKINSNITTNIFGRTIDRNFISSVFPSPTSGLFTIECKLDRTCNLKVNILNNLGQQVYTETNLDFHGKYSKVFDLGKLTKGIYFVELNTGDYKSVRKIVLE
jgi:hypothetical protein